MTDKYESLDELFDDEEFEISEESEDNVPPEVRNRLALALDVDDLIDARRLAGSLFDFFGTVKVGLELYTASGPDSVGVFTEAGFDVFCDLKLHDIPTTVHKAARVVGSVGARWVTVHTAGGDEMLKAAVEGLTLSLATELAPEIRVNCIAPGLTESGMSKGLISNDTIKKAIANMNPIPKLGQASDFGKISSFLLGENNKWITGQIIGVDGGRSTLA